MKKHSIIILLVLLSFTSLYAIDMSSAATGAQKDIFTMVPATDALDVEVDPAVYIVGPGDQFMVEKPQDKVSLAIPVSPSGDLFIPGMGAVNVGGKTLVEAVELISRKTGPYSSAYLYNIKSVRIPVTGAVKFPGIYTISAAWRLSDLLKKIPIRYLGKDFAIEIRKGSESRTVNIYDFYVNGNLESNPYLTSGESIYVPFADPEVECIEVFGPVMVKSLVPFIKGETLGDFYRRKILLTDAMDYEKIVVERDNKFLTVTGNEMYDFVLKPEDRVEFIILDQIMISGHVNRPGTYSYVPGHTVVDYIAMAGGVNYKGSNESAILIRGGKKIKNPINIDIRRGDIILVNRSAEDIFIGEISILSFVSMLASIASTVITAFIAAGNL